MKIDRSLALVVVVDRDDGSVVHVHSKPISRAAFDDCWRMLTMAYSDISRSGITPDAAMRVSMRMIREAAGAAYPETGEGKTVASVFEAFRTEIRRNSQVIARRENGWEPIPFDNAVGRGLLTEDDAEEVENILGFFTLTCAVAQPNRAKAMIEWVKYFIAAQTTSLDYMAFARSLPTSTAAESSGVSERPEG